MRLLLSTLALAASLQAPRRPTKQHTKLQAKRSSKPPSSKGPRRITSDGVKRSGLSLRTQLSLVRAVNNAQAPTKQVREKKRTGITKRNETRANVTEVLYERSLLLVDGYNVVFGSPNLKTMSEKSLDQAREALVAGCESVAAARNWDVVVVFDAPQTDDERIEDVRSPRTTVVFTDRMESADAFIEKVAEERRGLGDGATLVATNDGMIRLMAAARNAGVLNVAGLIDAIEGAEKALASRLKANRNANAMQKDDYDVLQDLAARHTSAAEEQRNALRAQQRSDHRRLLERIAHSRSLVDVARLAAIERTMSDGDRRAFDGDKRLLGLLDLLGTAWWEGAEGEALGGVPP